MMFLLLFIPIAAAENVNVGIYVLNLGKYEIATGSFTADFYLSLKCDDICNTDFEFMNGRAASTEKIIDLPSEKFYRIQANLMSPVDLRKFPFDSQKMQIILEDKTKQIGEVNYVPVNEESGIDDSIAFTGWKIDGWEAETAQHDYPVYDESYSKYLFTINISRMFINSFLKTFLPVIFIMLIVLFSFIMDPDKITTRLTVCTSSLIASVMFHISMSNQIPPVGYLTTADRFMILTYFLLLVSVLLNVILLELLEQKKTELVEKVHRATEYSMLMVVPIIYILFFLLFI
jgi:hypothetical protein